MPSARIERGGTRGTVFRAVAELRIRDAKALLDARRLNGAIYLAGYSIECYLKYAYCERSRTIHLPADLETHRWDTLVESAGLVGDLKSAPKIFGLYSALADAWGPSLRYETGPYHPGQALRLYKEFSQLYQFLRELVP